MNALRSWLLGIACFAICTPQHMLLSCCCSRLQCHAPASEVSDTVEVCEQMVPASYRQVAVERQYPSKAVRLRGTAVRHTPKRQQSQKATAARDPIQRNEKQQSSMELETPSAIVAALRLAKRQLYLLQVPRIKAYRCIRPSWSHGTFPH